MSPRPTDPTPRLLHTKAHEVRGRLEDVGLRSGSDTGSPRVGARVLHAAGPVVGIWECTPGGWPISDREDTETCIILSGRARVTEGATNKICEVSSGDVLILPKGWSGRWDVIEPVRKVYVLSHD
jgi:uncharacterized protein